MVNKEQRLQKGLLGTLNPVCLNYRHFQSRSLVQRNPQNVCSAHLTPLNDSFFSNWKLGIHSKMLGFREMSKGGIKAILSIVGCFDIKWFGRWNFQLFTESMSYTSMLSCLSLFPEGMFFCSPFQRKINFLGDQGLDLFNSFPYSPPSKDSPSPKENISVLES